MSKQIQTTTTTFAPQKSMLLAYVLWFFLGEFGVHRFYLKRKGIGILQLVLTLLGYSTLFFGIGGAFLIIVGIWLIVDLFLIPGMVRSAGGSSDALFTTTTTTTTTVVEDANQESE